MTHRLVFLKKVFLLIYDLLFTFLTLLFLHNIFLSHRIGYIIFFPTMLIFVLSYIIREKMRNYGFIIFFHIIMFLAIYITSWWNITKVIFFVIIAILTVLSCKYVYRGKRMTKLNGLPLASFLFCIIYYLFAFFLKKNDFFDDVYIITIIMLFVYMINVYIDGLGGYIDNTRDVTGVPLSQIIKINTIYVGFIVLFVGVSILFLYFVDIRWIFTSISGFFIWIFKVLFYAFLIISAVIKMFLKDEDASGKVNDYIEQMKMQAPANSSMLDTILLMILFTTLLLIVLYKVLKKIIKVILSKGIIGDDLVEKADVSIPDNKNDNLNRSLFGLRLTMEEKARKLYRYRIKRYKNDIRLDDYVTSKEIMASIEENNLGDVRDISHLYSDIRYGNLTVDKKILKNMNKLYKQ